jgi:hypothetical protein
MILKYLINTKFFISRFKQIILSSVSIIIVLIILGIWPRETNLLKNDLCMAERNFVVVFNCSEAIDVNFGLVTCYISCSLVAIAALFLDLRTDFLWFILGKR